MSVILPRMLEALRRARSVGARRPRFLPLLGIALAAVMLWRFRFPGKTAVEGGMALPIVVPEICLGVAMLVFFASFVVPITVVTLVAVMVRHTPKR